MATRTVRDARMALRNLEPATRRAGSLLLRTSAGRAALNWLYVNCGPRARRSVIAAIKNSRTTQAFTWRCRVGRNSFLLPVLPDSPRSWNAALLWGSAGNRVIKSFYEFHLRHRGSGGFLDVGSNDGTHAYPFAAHGYDCVCIEPQPSCIDYLESTKRLNGFDDLRVVNTAVGNAAGESVEFFISDHTWHSSLIREEVENYEQSRSIRVPLTTLDALVRNLGFKPTLMKIDVEGVEADVVAGAREMLSQHRPSAVIEIRSKPEIRAPIWSRFTELGY